VIFSCSVSLGSHGPLPARPFLPRWPSPARSRAVFSAVRARELHSHSFLRPSARRHVEAHRPPHARVMAAPHLGHCIWAHGTPRPCGAVAPHWGQTHWPPGPAANGPPMRPPPALRRPRPRPPVPGPWPVGPVPSPRGIVIPPCSGGPPRAARPFAPPVRGHRTVAATAPEASWVRVTSLVARPGVRQSACGSLPGRW
jgi:hypothetical protein